MVVIVCVLLKALLFDPCPLGLPDVLLKVADTRARKAACWVVSRHELALGLVRGRLEGWCRFGSRFVNGGFTAGMR